jgi:hypothetical protein
MAKNSGFLPTNNHLAHQLKAKNENVGEVANPSLSSDEVPHDSKKKKKNPTAQMTSASQPAHQSPLIRPKSLHVRLD